MKPLLPLVLLLAAPAFADPPATGTTLEMSVTASVTQAPDLATVSTAVVTQAGSAGSAMAENARRMNGTVAALARAGVAPRDIQTASISLSPQYRYTDGQPPVLTGYQASNRVTARLRDVTRTGAVLDALVAAGADQIEGPTFSVEHPEGGLDQARGQALAAARARAELYARAAGLRVVRIAHIQEEGGSPPVVRPMMMTASRAKLDTPVEAGEEALSVTLAVTFELG